MWLTREDGTKYFYSRSLVLRNKRKLAFRVRAFPPEFPKPFLLIVPWYKVKEYGLTFGKSITTVQELKNALRIAKEELNYFKGLAEKFSIES